MWYSHPTQKAKKIIKIPKTDKNWQIFAENPQKVGKSASAKTIKLKKG